MQGTERAVSIQVFNQLFLTSLQGILYWCRAVQT